MSAVRLSSHETTVSSMRHLVNQGSTPVVGLSMEQLSILHPRVPTLSGMFVSAGHKLQAYHHKS